MDQSETVDQEKLDEFKKSMMDQMADMQRPAGIAIHWSIFLIGFIVFFTLVGTNQNASLSIYFVVHARVCIIFCLPHAKLTLFFIVCLKV